jgi:putative two-component system response regulator
VKALLRKSPGDAPGSTVSIPRAIVMIVDDDPVMRDCVADILKTAHYLVIHAATAGEARSCWNEHRPQVAIVDLDLDGESGAVLLDEQWVRGLDTAVVALTESDDIDVADESFEHGASGYLVKPFTANELLMQVSNALRRRRLERAVADQVRALERNVIESAAGVTVLNDRLQLVTLGSSLADERIIGHLSSAVSMRDDDSGNHIERVSATSAALAEWGGFDVDPTQSIRLAAAMHDVGKIGIPDWVLLKPGSLTPDERMIIEHHCELGYALLSGSASPVLNLAASVALNHHERWDGDGYPNRRRGVEIPLEARIIAIAHVFDDLTRDRVYRAALPVDTAVDVMLRERGGRFDPKMLDIFLDRLDEVLALVKDLADPPTARTTRIVVAGGEPVIVDGLMRLLSRKGEMRVIGSGYTVTDAIAAVSDLQPDVLLVDYGMPDGDAARLTETVRGEHPETKVIVLTDASAPEGALRCIAAGCSGVVARTAPIDDIAKAVRRVHDGEVAIPPALLAQFAAELRRGGRRIGDDITRRERELLGYLARGLALPEVASAMSISMATARNHTQRVIEKLGAHSKLEAVVVAMREGVPIGLSHLDAPEPRAWN